MRTFSENWFTSTRKTSQQPLQVHWSGQNNQCQPTKRSAPGRRKVGLFIVSGESMLTYTTSSSYYQHCDCHSGDSSANPGFCHGGHSTHSVIDNNPNPSSLCTFLLHFLTLHCLTTLWYTLMYTFVLHFFFATLFATLSATLFCYTFLGTIPCYIFLPYLAHCSQKCSQKCNQRV